MCWTTMRYFIFSFLLFSCATTIAQKNYKFENITVDNGLSQSSINSMVQDKFGFLWIGTQDGLNRYDGNNFKVYRHKDSDSTSLPNNHICRIYIDNENNLWVTSIGYLSKYDPFSETFKNFNISIKGGAKPGLSTYDIFTSRLNDLILCLGKDGGVLAFNPVTEKFYKPEAIGINSHAFAYIESKSLGDWIFYEDSIKRKDPIKQTWETFYKKVDAVHYTEQSGRLFISSYMSYIEEFNNINGRFETLTQLPLSKQNTQGWFGNVFITIFNETTQTLKLDGIQTTHVSCIYKTRDGVIWIGTNGFGLKKFNPFTNRFSYLGKSPDQDLHLADNYVDAIYTDDDKVLYIATPAGLDIIDIEKRVTQHINFPENGFPDRIFSISKNSQNQLMFACPNGVYRLRDNKFYQTDFNRNIWTSKIYDLTDQYLFVGEEAAIVNKIGAKKDFLVNKTNTEQTRASYINRDTLFINLTDEMLLLFDLKTNKKLKSIPYNIDVRKAPPPGTNVKCIFQDSKHNVWIGTGGFGLYRYRPLKNTIDNFTEREGLPNNVIYGILEDDNQNLWISTNKGLCELNIMTNKIRNFDVYDGLQSNEFNTGASFKSSSGTMYFGGVNGLTYFHPDNIVTSSSIPQSVISGFYVNNNLLKDYSGYVSKNKENNQPILTLQYTERDFGFDVVGIGFSLPSRTRYRYMLENYDDKWHDIGNLQHISFTNIPPGDYVFKVQSSDPYGNWEEIGTSVQVSIQSPIWRNPWALVIIAVAFGLILTTSINARIKFLRKRSLERIKEQEDLLKTSIEIQEEERKRIAQDLHDELGAVLSITRMHIVQLQDQGKNANTELGLQQVKTLTETALATMRRISHELMPPQLDEFGLTKTLNALVVQLNETKKISCSFLPPDQPNRLPKSIELGIYRVCMELVNNTLKHAGATHIHIQLLHGQHSVLFAYSDNGKGLPENYIQGHGFKNMEARINTLGGDFKFGNREEGGFYATLRMEI